MLLAGSLLGACTLFVSTDDLHSAPTDASNAGDAGDDAPSPALEGGPADPPPDAETPIPFCARRTSTFCSDFSGGAPAAGWSRSDVNRGALELVADGPTAPVLRASLSDGSGDKSARLHRDFETTPSEVHVEMTVQAAAAPAKLRELMKLEIPTSHENAARGYFSSGIMIQLLGSQLRITVERFDENGTALATPYVADASFPIGVWAHLELDAVLSPSAGSLEMKVDGATVISQTGIPTLTDGPQGARFIVGAFAFDLEPPTVDLIDDVLYDAK